MADNRPFEVAELDHVVLRCRDQARMLEFYTGVLGLREERRLERLGLIQLRAGQSMVDLVPADQRGPEAGRNMEHFCLGIKVGAFGPLMEYLRAHGVQVAGEPDTRYGSRGSGLSVYLEDPEGNVVELKEIPRPA